MSQEDNPHFRVVLMNSWSRSLLKYTTLLNLDNSAYNLIHSIQNDEATNSRIWYILDAIASTSVSKKKKQELAVGHQFIVDVARIKLVLEKNPGVQKGL